jgi:hypothetical protein
LRVRWSFRELLSLKFYIIFRRKFKSHKLFVVERRKQLEYDKCPLTLKIGEGQRSRSPKFYKNNAFLYLLHNMRYLKDIRCYFIPIQTNHCGFDGKSELWTFPKLLNEMTKTLVISLFWKLHTVHAWKFIYDKNWISWRHCAFVLRVQWSLRELLPLKSYNFYAKI